jgi:hypothetical protein
VKKIQQRQSLAMAAGRAALRRGRGAAPTGSGDENLQPIELDEPLVNPKRKEEGRGCGPSPAAMIARRRREPEAVAGNWGSSKRVGVLGRQREAQAIEHGFK